MSGPVEASVPLTVGAVGEELVIPTPQFGPAFRLTRTRLDPARYWQAAAYDGPQWLWALTGPAGVIVLIAGRHHAEPGVCTDCLRYREIRPIDQDGNCWKTWDLGRHSPRPRWPDETPVADGAACEHLGGRPCYYDGSGLQSDHLVQRWLADGARDEHLAGELREYYTSWLGER